MQRKRRSMSSRLLVAILSTTILMLVVCFALIYTVTMHSLRDQYQLGAQESLRQIAIAVDRFAEDAENLSLLLEFDGGVEALVGVDPGDQLESISARWRYISAIKSQTLSRRNLYSAIIINSGGGLYGASSSRTYDVTDAASYGSTRTLTTIDDRRFYWLGGYTDMDFTDIRNPIYTAENNTEVILCARRVLEQSSALNGAIILLCFRKSALAELFSAFTWPYNGLFLLDENGAQIWGSNSAHDGKTPDFVADFPPSLKSANIKLDGVDMHAFSAPVGERGWRIVSMVPISYYLENMQPALMSMLIIGLVTLFTLLLLCTGIVSRQIRPLREMAAIMHKVSGGTLAIRMPEDLDTYEYSVIANQFNRMMTNIQSLIVSNRHAEEEKRTLELEVLQAQINPHFLLNTLLSIRWIAVMTHMDSISQSLTHLCQLIEPLFRDLTESWSLRQECDFIHHYVALMDVRFGNKAEFIMDVDEGVLDAEIPRFVLQPLLENSYEHSIGGRECVVIRLDIGITGDRLRLCVSDTGRGITPEQLEHIREVIHTGDKAGRPRGIGIANVYRRLKLHYNESATLAIDTAPDQGVRVEIGIALSAINSAPEDR